MTRHPDHATIWADAIRASRSLDPPTIAARIIAGADNGLRAARTDGQGGRTTFRACDDRHCFDGDPEVFPHSHVVTNDPTGNTAVGHLTASFDDTSRDELRRLQVAADAFVVNANVVLAYVSGEIGSTWVEVRSIAHRLMPGTIQAGLDVDVERALPRRIEAVGRAVRDVAGVAANHLPRDPSADERHWTAGMADEDCCAWHLAIHRRYRRPRLAGKNICGDCASLALLGGMKPPAWLLEAEVDRGSKPKAWTLALGRWLDELGIPREQAC